MSNVTPFCHFLMKEGVIFQWQFKFQLYPTTRCPKIGLTSFPPLSSPSSFVRFSFVRSLSSLVSLPFQRILNLFLIRSKNEVLINTSFLCGSSHLPPRRVDKLFDLSNFRKPVQKYFLKRSMKLNIWNKVEFVNQLKSKVMSSKDSFSFHKGKLSNELVLFLFNVF